MKSYDSWWKEITSDEQWYETMQMMHKGKLIPAAKHIYGEYMADVETFKVKPMKDQRMHIHNKAAKMSWKDVPAVGVSLQQESKIVEPESNGEPVAPPLTGDARLAKLKEWKALVDSSPIGNSVPKITHKQIAEEGDWIPKKKMDYVPVVDAALLRLKEAITKFAARKYRDRYDFRNFNSFAFGLVEVVAESQKDAEEILEKAKRLTRRK